MFSTVTDKEELQKQLLATQGGDDEPISLLNNYNKKFPNDVDWYIKDEWGCDVWFSNFLCKNFSLKVVMHWESISGTTFSRVDKGGESSLYHAAHKDDIELVKFLLERSVCANVANENGFAPLTLAVLNHSHAVMRLLLEHHADPNGDPRCVHSPLEAAITLDDGDTCQILIEAGSIMGDGLGIHSPLYRARHSDNQAIRAAFGLE